MPRRRKSTSVAFKVDAELFRYLADVPNRSEFIRRAVFLALGVECPLCRGDGTIPIPVGSHFEPVLAAHNRVACQRCGREGPIPPGLNLLDLAPSSAWAQFLRGEPYHCPTCSQLD